MNKYIFRKITKLVILSAISPYMISKTNDLNIEKSQLLSVHELGTTVLI